MYATILQGLAIAAELEDQLGEGVINNNMGMTYEMLANLDQTQDHFEKVGMLISGSNDGYGQLRFSTPIQELELMKKENNLYGQALALKNLARTYEHVANLAKAAETLESVSHLKQ